MNFKSIAFLAMATLWLASCQQESGIQLRIENASNIHFDEVLVNNISFGPLEANEVSSYIPFEYIYKKEYIKVVAGDRIIELIPEDFSDKDYYNNGNYKYVINILHNKWIDLKFHTD